jgi:hypothetical protein
MAASDTNKKHHPSQRENSQTLSPIYLKDATTGRRTGTPNNNTEEQPRTPDPTLWGIKRQEQVHTHQNGVAAHASASKKAKTHHEGHDSRPKEEWQAKACVMCT